MLCHVAVTLNLFQGLICKEMPKQVRLDALSSCNFVSFVVKR
jgi:hypothetical protein